jgi:malate permease and related proteins
MLSLFLETLNITAPVFAMLFMGLLLKRIGWIDDGFIKVASELVFNVTMPCLLFLGIIHANLNEALQIGVMVYFAIATVISFGLIWLWARWHCPVADRGIYVQGAFRGNNGIIGLALAASMYGDYGIAVGSILAAVLIVLYNSLSSVVLAYYSPSMKSDPLSLAVGVVRNPLILGVVAAIPFAVWQIPLPGWLDQSAQYLAHMTLPLALICIGGTLSLSALRAGSHLAISASLVKMVALPLVATLGAWACGFRGADLGILFLYFGAPTASVSYVMARAANGNYRLAATIVVITTIAAIVTTNVGIFLLHWGGLI